VFKKWEGRVQRTNAHGNQEKKKVRGNATTSKRKVPLHLRHRGRKEGETERSDRRPPLGRKEGTNTFEATKLTTKKKLRPHKAQQQVLSQIHLLGKRRGKRRKTALKK